MDVNHSVGPILLGAFFNALLLGIIIVQCHAYFLNFPCDRVWLKLLVCYLLVMNLANTGFDIALVWHYTVQMFGNFEGIQKSMWLYTIEPVMTAMISTVTQLFYAWRIARLTGWTWVGHGIAGSALIQLCAGIGGSIGTSLVKDFAMFHKFKIAVIIWLTLSAVTDTLISAILAWYLHHHRTGFPTTDHAISRLIRLAIQTGVITTACAVADLVTFLCLSDNMHLFFQLILCKTYTNTLLATLNARAGPSTSKSPTAEAQEAPGVGHNLRQRLHLTPSPSKRESSSTQRSPIKPKAWHLEGNPSPRSSPANYESKSRIEIA